MIHFTLRIVAFLLPFSSLWAQQNYDKEIPWSWQIETLQWHSNAEPASAIVLQPRYLAQEEKVFFTPRYWFCADTQGMLRAWCDIKKSTHKKYRSNLEILWDIPNINVHALPHGLFYIYDGDGHLLKKLQYENGVLEGWQHFFYPKTGRLRARIMCHDDKRHGSVEMFDAEGQCTLTGLYINNRKAGLWEYKEGAQIVRTIEYQNGHPHGKSWFKENNRQTTRIFTNGMIAQEYVCENNQRISEEKFLNGVAHGTKIFFNQYEQPTNIIAYRAGQKEGLEKSFDRRGKGIATLLWSQNHPVRAGQRVQLHASRVQSYQKKLQKERSGGWRKNTLYYNGKTKKKLLYNLNYQKNGPYTLYHPNGAVQEKGCYSDGLRNGTRYIYNARGTLIRRDTWNKGVRHGPWQTRDGSGNIVAQGTYVHDQLHGRYIKKGKTSAAHFSYVHGMLEGPFHIKGKKLFIAGSYHQNQHHGQYEESTSNTHMLSNFSHGVLDGPKLVKDKKNKIISCNHYANGLLHGPQEENNQQTHFNMGIPEGYSVSSQQTTFWYRGRPKGTRFEKRSHTFFGKYVGTVKQGPFQVHHHGIRYNGWFHKGLMHGPFEIRHKDGIRRGIYQWGKWHGIVYDYDVDNNVIAASSYKNGVLDGPCHTFHKGELIRRTYYKKGHCSGRRARYHAGRLIQETEFNAGKKHGTDLWYNPDGSIRYYYEYKNGQRIG